MARSILITFTFTHEDSTEETTTQGYPVKKWTPYDAWSSITPLINQFKMELSRIIGSEQIFRGHEGTKQANYGSCLVKEGTTSMYPSPHLVVVFQRPLIAHRWGRQWLLGPSGRDRSLVDRIQAIWERIAGSHCKINAIVSEDGFRYVFKYVTKSVDIDDAAKTLIYDGMPSKLTKRQKSSLVALNTHMNQSIHNLNDVISPSFLSMLDYTKELTLLDITRTKLKQMIRERDKLINEIEAFGGWNAFTFSINPHLRTYWDVVERLNALREEAYRLKMETSPWFFVSGGYTSVADAINHVS